MNRPQPIPDLPPHDGDDLTLRQVCNLKLVSAGKGGRLAAEQLQRWATRGFRPVAGGTAYQFPTIKGDRERLTCAAWCRAWNEWIGRVRAAAVRSQLDVFQRCKAAAGRV